MNNFIFFFRQKLTDTITAIKNLIIPPHLQAMHLSGYYYYPFIIKAGLDLDLFNILDGKYLTAIANKISIPAEKLEVLLSALTSIGLVVRKTDGLYRLTKVGQCFSQQATHSVVPITNYVLDEAMISPMINIAEGLRKNSNSFHLQHQMDLYAYCNQHKAFSDTLSMAMKFYTTLDIPQIIGRDDFSHYGTVADIGGGAGYLLEAILLKHRQLEGVLFDRESPIKKAKSSIGEGLVNKERINFVSGDMFTEIPVDADLYIISRVLNDWSDTEVNKILSNVREAMSSTSKLLIVESIKKDGYTFVEDTFRDLAMLVYTPGGRMRSKGEFEHLLADVGLRINKITATKRSLSLIECSL